MKTSETIAKISPAMMNASSEIHNMATTKQGYGYRYLELNAILESVKPILLKHQLFILQTVTSEDQSKIGITTRLMHSSGEFFEDTFYLPPTESKQMNKVQAMGSSITYGRRYGLSTILSIAVDDDMDGRTDPPKPELTTEQLKEKINKYLNHEANKAIINSNEKALPYINDKLENGNLADLKKVLSTIESKPGIQIIV